MPSWCYAFRPRTTRVYCVPTHQDCLPSADRVVSPPMPISWNEIRRNAVAFSKDWATESSEDAEAKTFWDEFFAVFGIKRRTVASFEDPVKRLTGNWGYIDL